jgi:hypothetical protein
MIRSPFDVRESASEAEQQTALILWVRTAERYGFETANQPSSYFGKPMRSAESDAVPELHWLHAIPNGGRRDTVTAVKLQMQGVRAGVWDLFLPLPILYASPPVCGCYIEMKSAKGVLSSEQKRFRDDNIAHYDFYVCCSWPQAAAVIRRYVTNYRTNSNDSKNKCDTDSAIA